MDVWNKEVHESVKGYVRNRHRLQGCIMESYIVEEEVEFCTEYMVDCEAIGLPKNTLSWLIGS